MLRVGDNKPEQQKRVFQTQGSFFPGTALPASFPSALGPRGERQSPIAGAHTGTPLRRPVPLPLPSPPLCGDVGAPLCTVK